MPPTAPYTTDVLGQRVLVKRIPFGEREEVRAAFVATVPETQQDATPAVTLVGLTVLDGTATSGAGGAVLPLFPDEAAADAYLAEATLDVAAAYWPAG
jgi:hypothetical protein